MNVIAPRQARTALPSHTDQPANGTVFWVVKENKTGLCEMLAREVAVRAGLATSEVEIVSRPGRSPQVEWRGIPNSDWHVSFSHTHRYSAGALSFGRAVGIDVEWIDPALRWEPVAAEFFSFEEFEARSRVTPHDGRREFFQHWVRWEAALKCRGTGFGAGHLPPAKATAGLELIDLKLDAGWVGCLARACAPEE